MDKLTIAEEAYKNGYEKGLKEAVKHGRWKFRNDYQSLCSECYEVVWVDHDDEPNYCPNCGAKMDGDGNG